MNTILKVVILFMVFKPAFANSSSSDFANPIAGFILLMVFLMGAAHIINSIMDKPFEAFRMIIGMCAALCIGIGLPMFVGFSFKIGGWILPLWIISWILAWEVGELLCGVKDDTSVNNNENL